MSLPDKKEILLYFRLRNESIDLINRIKKALESKDASEESIKEFLTVEKDNFFELFKNLEQLETYFEKKGETKFAHIISNNKNQLKLKFDELESRVNKKPEVEYVPHDEKESAPEDDKKPFAGMLYSLGEMLGQLVEFLKKLFTEVTKTMTFAFDQISKGFKSISEKKEHEEKEEMESSVTRRAATAV